MPLSLTGTEELTLEVPGSLPREKAEALAGELEVEHVRGVTPVSLLIFRIGAVGHAHWRVSVVHHGSPAWLVVACDVESAFVRKNAATLVRFPVRPAVFTFDGSVARGAMSIESKGKRFVIMAISDTTREPPPDEARVMLVRSSASLFQIPWSTETAPFRRMARVAFAAEELGEATFGSAIRWGEEGALHQGRVQHSGIAERL